MIALKGSISEKQMERMSSLIRDMVSLFSKDVPKHEIAGIKNVQKFELYQAILYDTLMETSNLVNELEALKSDTAGPIFSILGSMKDLPKEKVTVHEFLVRLNSEVKKIRSRKTNEYTVTIPMNLQLRITDAQLKDFIKSLNTCFGFETITWERLERDLAGLDQQNISKVKLAYQTSFLMRKTVNARTIDFATNEADKSFESFLGLVLLSLHLFRDTTKFGYGRPQFNLTKYNPPELIFINENKKLVYPQKTNLHFFQQKDISEEKLELDSDHYNRCLWLTEAFSKIKNRSLHEAILQAFALYFKACMETDLEISFLKFWIITEILLRGTRKSDDKFISQLKKLMSDYWVRERMDFLYKKRNQLVHKFRVDYISQEDRNLSKLIAENTLLFVLADYGVFENLNELDFALENLNEQKADLNRKIAILKKISKKHKPK